MLYQLAMAWEAAGTPIMRFIRKVIARFRYVHFSALGLVPPQGLALIFSCCGLLGEAGSAFKVSELGRIHS